MDTRQTWEFRAGGVGSPNVYYFLQNEAGAVATARELHTRYETAVFYRPEGGSWRVTAKRKNERRETPIFKALQKEYEGKFDKTSYYAILVTGTDKKGKPITAHLTNPVTDDIQKAREMLPDAMRAVREVYPDADIQYDEGATFFDAFSTPLGDQRLALVRADPEAREGGEYAMIWSRVKNKTKKPDSMGVVSRNLEGLKQLVGFGSNESIDSIQEMLVNSHWEDESNQSIDPPVVYETTPISWISIKKSDDFSLFQFYTLTHLSQLPS